MVKWRCRRQVWCNSRLEVRTTPRAHIGTQCHHSAKAADMKVLGISSAGHPLALVRRADGRVETFGRPGTLLGVLPVPDLHDSRTVLLDGDSLILFTDGVTEARRQADRDFYGDGRLRGLVAVPAAPGERALRGLPGVPGPSAP